jgi:ribonuclease P protein component
MKPVKLSPIKGYKTFSIVFDAGVKQKKYPVLASFVYDVENIGLSPFRQEELSEEGHVFFGVAISKRRARKAVVRNRIKRLLRESVRLVFKEFDESGITPEFKAFTLLMLKAPKRPKEIGLDEVLPSVRKALIAAQTRPEQTREEI